MATLIEPPKGFRSEGKRCYTMWETNFEVDFKYVPIKALGRGSYGAVCSSMNMETYEKVAIKKIGDIFASPLDALRTLREMKLLRQIQHENVIALKDVMTPLRRTSFTDVYLVFELMDTDLYHIIKSPQPLSNDHCQYFLFQLLRGLDYLHSAKILHCDLKPENLLVNANCDLKICDFGLARICQGHGEPVTEYLVTRWYRAPELLLGCRSYGFPIDVWSVGCIFAELLRRKPLFPGRDILNQLELIIGILGTPSEADLDFIDDPIARKYVDSFPDQAGIPLFCLFPEAGPLAIDLLSKMLRFNPTKRYTVREALEHPYLSDLYDPSYDLPANVPLHLDMGESLEAGEIREMMWREMLHFHPEAAGSDACVDKSTADRNT